MTKAKPAKGGHKIPSIRVLIVDEHELVRRGLASVLGEESDMEVAGVCDNAGALECIKKLKPDVAVVDITLRGPQGLDLIKQIAYNPQTRILAVDLHGETTLATRAIKSGAKGYVTKNTESALAPAIRRIHAGQLAVSDDIAQEMVAVLTSNVGAGEPMDALSDRELELAEHIGKGEGATDIAKNLGISIKTVETHKAHMKKKLGIATGAQLTRYCVEWVTARQHRRT